MSAQTKPISVARVASGTKRATFSASPSRRDRTCRASNTCLYWSHPLNLGTFVVVNAAGLGRAGGVHVAGVGRFGGANFSLYVSFRNRATVCIRSACCGLRKSAPGCVLVSGGSLLITGVGSSNLNGFGLASPLRPSRWDSSWTGVAALQPTVPSLYLSARNHVRPGPRGTDSGARSVPHGWWKTTSESVVLLDRSSPATPKTFGSSVSSWLNF